MADLFKTYYECLTCRKQHGDLLAATFCCPRSRIVMECTGCGEKFDRATHASRHRRAYEADGYCPSRSVFYAKPPRIVA